MKMENPGEKVRQILANPAVRQGAAEAFGRTFHSAGVAYPQSQILAEQVLDTLLSRGPDEAQEFLGQVFRETPAKTRYAGETNLRSAFEAFMGMRSKAFSSQIMYVLSDMPDGIRVANISAHHEPLQQRQERFNVLEAENVSGLRGAFEVAVLNNILHHETPEEAESLLKAISASDARRLVIVENMTVGEDDVQRKLDRDVQFVHEYLFHRLLPGSKGAHTPLPGNYDSADGWRQKIEKMGWQESLRDSFIMEPHHTVLVFEREP